MPHPPQIPLTPQTSEANFPRHNPLAPPGQSGHDYPKMLTRPFTKDDRDIWLERNVRVDMNTNKRYYDDRVPKIGDPVPIVATQDLVDAGLAQLVGDPVVVNDAEDEQSVYETLGIEPVQAKPAVISVPIAGSREVELAAENERLKAALESRIRDVQPKDPKRRVGWPKGKPRKPRPVPDEAVE
jgi:hypothetical protein